MIYSIDYQSERNFASAVKVYYNLSKYSIPMKAIKDLKKGELFRLKDSETAPVWVRGEYIPSERKYSTHKYEDVNHERLLKGTTSIFVGFTY